MPRGKKNADTIAAETTQPKARRGRKPKAEAPAAEQAPAPEYTTKEQELLKKYPHQTGLIPQSYRVAGAEDRPGWGHKHTVAIACCEPGCQEVRIIATSDLQWTWTRFCLPHAKAAKKAAKANEPKKGKKAKTEKE